MNYTEDQLPIRIHHGEIVTLHDGTEVRFESNGEAKDIFLGDAYAPTVQLFPDTDYEFSTEGGTYKVTALFEDALNVEKVS